MVNLSPDSILNSHVHTLTGLIPRLEKPMVKLSKAESKKRIITSIIGLSPKVESESMSL